MVRQTVRTVADIRRLFSLGQPDTRKDQYGTDGSNGRNALIEYGSRGIRVNAVLPGSTDTGMKAEFEKMAGGADKLLTLVVNSLLETNLGMPYIYAIFIAFSAKFTERLKRRTLPLSFTERLRENNREKVRTGGGEYLGN